MYNISNGMSHIPQEVRNAVNAVAQKQQMLLKERHRMYTPEYKSNPDLESKISNCKAMEQKIVDYKAEVGTVLRLASKHKVGIDTKGLMDVVKKIEIICILDRLSFQVQFPDLEQKALLELEELYKKHPEIAEVAKKVRKQS